MAYIFDSFTRADSTTSLGTADSGQSWTALSGTWGINSNQAYIPSTQSACLADINSSVADAFVTVKIAATAASGQGNAGIIFRLTSTGNYWRCFADATSGQIQLQKVVSGSSTGLFAGSSFTAGDFIGVELSGSSIKVLKNGVVVSTQTDSFNSTATSHGMWLNTGTAWRLDDFSAGPLATEATETDTANVGAPAIVVAGSMATETDIANSGVTVTGAQASESDTANAGTPLIVGSQASEADTANAGSQSSSSSGWPSPLCLFDALPIKAF